MCLFRKKKLIEYRLEIHGMKCGMCESHINDVVRKNFNVTKVKSNRFKNETIIFCEKELDEELIKSVITSTGYELKGMKKVNSNA